MNQLFALAILAALLISSGCRRQASETPPSPTPSTAAAQAPEPSVSTPEAVAATSDVAFSAGFREQRLTASDGAPFDHLGFSVACGDGVVVAGARFADLGGRVDAGAVYVFRLGSSGWRQEAKLVAADPYEHDRFGHAVAIDGDTLVVGAHAHHELGRKVGSAYVFRYRGGAWRQEAKLGVPGAARFGHSVAVSGDRIAVGAPGDAVAGQPAGAVYLFQRRGKSWQREARLTAEDAAPFDLFGVAVGASGESVLVGASADDDRGSMTGAAYVFRRSGSAWRQESKLLPDDAYALYELGKAVALDGDTAVVGADGAGDIGKFAGAAYVFRRVGEAWRQEAKLLATDRRPADRFGNAVAVYGDSMLAGAHFADPAGLGSGAAYVFRRAGEAWRQEAKLVPDGAAAGDEVGNAVAVCGRTVALGALRSGTGGTAAGSVSVFDGGDVPP